jgi:O-acetyl-ADP-ribose deacetylase (regulator of RNase III)
MAQGPVAPGECVITSGGQLPARHVIHAAVMGQDLQTSATLIDRATRGALEIAEAHQLQSIAFPAFGTGVGGFPLDEAARIEVEEVRRHLDAGSGLERVVFAVRGEEARGAFERALAS